MNTYKHYSFDLWMTLIKSNPDFKTERAKYFYNNFNEKRKGLNEILSVFRHVDLMCNSINEKTGNNIDADEMYLMVISMINDFNTPLADINMDSLYQEMELLLFNYMPTVYSSETFVSLDKIKQKSNSPFNISSNTAFIKGKTLRKILSSLSLSQFFDFQLYSDEINYSKPNERFFEVLLSKVKENLGIINILPSQIVHIGDNVKADIEGALAKGINAILINTNNQTIQSLIK